MTLDELRCLLPPPTSCYLPYRQLQPLIAPHAELRRVLRNATFDMDSALHKNGLPSIFTLFGEATYPGAG